MGEQLERRCAGNRVGAKHDRVPDRGVHNRRGGGRPAVSAPAAVSDAAGGHPSPCCCSSPTTQCTGPSAHPTEATRAGARAPQVPVPKAARPPAVGAGRAGHQAHGNGRRRLGARVNPQASGTLLTVWYPGRAGAGRRYQNAGRGGSLLPPPKRSLPSPPPCPPRGVPSCRCAPLPVPPPLLLPLPPPTSSRSTSCLQQRGG